MRFQCESLIIPTEMPIQIIDVSGSVREIFERYAVRNGQVTIASAHTTAFVALNEKEPKLQRDMLDFLTTLAPPARDYRHDIAPVDGRPNTHSHLIGLFMNASETILVADGKLLLGEWQSIFFVELDGPREQRKLTVQVAGEV
ncbi:secondary thiamine-phosphate synthase enzyme YjbQ [Thiorhodococcus minor]|uniref:YjbQ family protein n=1 Tax=Thiorhodococcus minor TaxID=57489 RepID=A0A6M0K082_9GAMM|nr:secondary thiamine-phosphate synthase enzyme YjbQ [Thiorhodococcus minor]NEV63166.1 YjbQ family protein [Thiorhodococcus minor]